MLVLARRTNEAIQIGPNITLTVLRVKGKTVKLGIEAPENISVVRHELLLRSADPGGGEETFGAPSDGQGSAMSDNSGAGAPESRSASRQPASSQAPASRPNRYSSPGRLLPRGDGTRSTPPPCAALAAY